MSELNFSLPGQSTEVTSVPGSPGSAAVAKIEAHLLTALGALRQPNKAPAVDRFPKELALRNHGVIDATRRILAFRRKREAVLGSKLFSDPAWDILLDLYSADVKQQRVTVSSACVAAAVPATTALRWLDNLTAIGLVARTDDPLDRRRCYVALTEVGRQKMDELFE